MPQSHTIALSPSVIARRTLSLRRPGGIEPSLKACAASLCLLACMATAQAQTSLDAMLKTQAEAAKFPALAAAVVVGGKMMAIGTAGTRRAGTATPVLRDDRFHLGSDTKAMTAVIAAMYIEEGTLRWDSTLAQVFPELAATMDAQVKTITVAQLLSHTSGLPSDNDAFGQLLDKSQLIEGNLDQQRYWMLTQAVKQPLVAEPGKAFAYSNLGYTLTGAIIERIGKKTWEELITERVFVPLKLTTAGLGPQSSLGRVDAPLGHRIVNDQPSAVLAGPFGDNPVILGPAGTAHMSVADFATWGSWMAGQGKRAPFLLKPETFKKLVTPVISMQAASTKATTVSGAASYALGWGSVKMPWSESPLPFHGGSNNLNKAYIWLDTERDAAIVVMTNIATSNTEAVMSEIGGQLYKSYVSKK